MKHIHFGTDLLHLSHMSERCYITQKTQKLIAFNSLLKLCNRIQQDASKTYLTKTVIAVACLSLLRSFPSHRRSRGCAAQNTIAHRAPRFRRMHQCQKINSNLTFALPMWMGYWPKKATPTRAVRFAGTCSRTHTADSHL